MRYSTATCCYNHDEFCINEVRAAGSKAVRPVTIFFLGGGGVFSVPSITIFPFLFSLFSAFPLSIPPQNGPLNTAN